MSLPGVSIADKPDTVYSQRVCANCVGWCVGSIIPIQVTILLKGALAWIYNNKISGE